MRAEGAQQNSSCVEQAHRPAGGVSDGEVEVERCRECKSKEEVGSSRLAAQEIRKEGICYAPKQVPEPQEEKSRKTRL